MALSRRQFLALPPLLLAPLAVGGLTVADNAQASAMRIDVDRDNLAKVGLKLKLSGGQIREELAHFRLEMPEKQPKLAHLWRVEVWLKQPAKQPYKTRRVSLKKQKGNLIGDFKVPRKALADARLVLRTGPHAPLAETMYSVDISSFTR